MGRKSKLTLGVQTKICDALQGGNYFNTACRYAGVAPSTGWEWLDRGEKERPRRGRGDIYAQFAEAIRAAEAETEIELVKDWKAQMGEDWRSIQTFLERRYPDTWGRKERRELVGEGGGPVVIDLFQLLKEATDEDNGRHD